MLSVSEALQHAVGLHQRGQLGEAERFYRQVLNAKSNHFEARHFLGLLRAQQGRHREALDLINAALTARPDDADALYNRGNVLAALTRYQEAIASYDAAIARRPDYVEAYSNRGNALLALQRSEEALASYERAVALRPDDAAAFCNRGTLLSKVGRFNEGLASYESALALWPDYPDALNGRGHVLAALRRCDEALASFDKTLAAEPNNAEAINGRGDVFLTLKRYEEALACFDQALAISPDDAEALNNRGHVLAQFGRHAEALASYDRALTIRPDDSEIHSNKIFALDFIAGLGFAEQQAARREWYNVHGKALAANILPHQNARDPSRRLVLGYVSSDFREHSATRTFAPQLRCHDHSRFEVVCYSGVNIEDSRTGEFRQLADKWVSMLGLSDEALAAQIRGDAVDILIDLSGHTAGNRLRMFALKPAPIQVTAWGHATGTGLATIDYLFSDPVSVPEIARPLFAETIYDLPCQITFEAASYAPPVSPLPALARGFVTFGCLNRFSKVTPAVLDLWARILRVLPTSRLLLKDTALNDPSLQARTRALLADRGVAPERIELRGGTPRPEHLATFNEVDIALDPFPQNGGASTWEALWGGVPVVVKLGDSLAGRLSGAILSAVGLTDWITENDDDYATLALKHAGNLEALGRLRAELRTIISKSAAGNPVRYTEAVEEAYRWMWQGWCSSRETGRRYDL
jgi:predicted O-linked N-acetylglucosamine transferase (SPINDLY family)